MIEKVIRLEEIDPVDIYGVKNRLIDLLAAYFPKMRVVARGSEINLKGSAKDIKLFEEKINRLIEIRSKKRRLSEDDVNSLFVVTQSGEVINELPESEIIVYGNEGKAINARTINQKKLVECYEKSDLIFAIGPAGTGKTYTAIALAVRALKNREVKRLLLTRPAVEAGERLGFLPGDMRDKLDPYLQPLYDALRDMIPAKRLAELMEDGIIQIAPLAYMRGRTLESAFVILDEAQNTTMGQLKMFLTRMGNNSKFIVTGDATQIDLPKKSDSGLLRGVKMTGQIKGVSVVEFDKGDIVRHPLVSKIVQVFEDNDE
ncbi:MAG: phosphate starvation-inducible protein PhoH [Bacteroidetes bacterium GWE2_39_28]|nr:MAG: phosphate starvation-inducible protein PhoH [Bacteroidetes bacterium GWE2_39_28]OFY12407.1 MAG: phosphate starvation-inducible protein PhoH [Bacteroidetes bacterium GWF2_39_10]OFZ06800.1 MAG: phosphate starvation-inducible protein PhoH [Bacteroidetes bacterium RIFOXYB2_FULL_39_7]HCT93345.1 phosphate starvation-inducible protein PhoH [Rikenellaceae bacterium]HCV15726.1 phosphate starvation-inducible protein PhoH [Rikenellaceae bacterium]